MKKYRMANRKYDYARLKQEYFLSDIKDVKSFFLYKIGKFNGNHTKATTGRKKQKQAFLDGIVEKELQKQQKKLMQEFKIPVSTLLKMKKASIELLAKRLTEFLPKKDENGNIIDEGEAINVKDIKDIIEITKNELGEPTRITDQRPAEVPELTEEDEGILEDIFGGNAKIPTKGKDENQTF